MIVRRAVIGAIGRDQLERAGRMDESLAGQDAGSAGRDSQAALPLVLDVDGTLLATDLLDESFWAALGRDGPGTLAAVLRALPDRARLKRALAGRAALRFDLLPVREEVLALARQAAAEGRPVVLASAADEGLVRALAEALGLEARVMASDGRRNLKGPAKAAALIAEFGEGGFDYAGDSAADLPVWRAARRAIVVGNRAAARRLRAEGREVVELGRRWRLRDLVRALRPHQWVKNVLLFLPLLAAQLFALGPWLMALAGAVAFSFGASAIYIVNDLLDLEADRRHPTKRNRPFAAGRVPIRVGMVTAGALALVALGIGAAIGPAFLGVLVFYMVLSLAYSLRLKRARWVDVATLATLYTLRAVAGAVAAEVPASGWLIAFIWPIFLTLGCVKRLTELTRASGAERLPGRGYGRGDRDDLLNMAGLGTVAALSVFLLYSFSDAAAALYPHRWLLWAAMVPMAGWLIRMIWLGWAGRQDYDPILFAMRDRYGISLLLFTLTLMLHAADRL